MSANSLSFLGVLKNLCNPPDLDDSQGVPSSPQARPTQSQSFQNSDVIDAEVIDWEYEDDSQPIDYNQYPYPMFDGTQESIQAELQRGQNAVSRAEAIRQQHQQRVAAILNGCKKPLAYSEQNAQNMQGYMAAMNRMANSYNPVTDSYSYSFDQNLYLINDYDPNGGM
jgi:hypothetical protein